MLVRNYRGFLPGAGDLTTGDILPSADVTYDLGSASAQWADIYLGDDLICDQSSRLVLDDDADTYIGCYGDDAIEFVAGGSRRAYISGAAIAITGGNIFYVHAGNASVPGIRGNNDADTGLIMADTIGQMAITCAGTIRFRLDNDATAGNTSMLLYDVDGAALVRVSVGADDSGGSGYKVLRIPN